MVGAFLLPNAVLTEPADTGEVCNESGSAKPANGSWQVAQDWLRLLDKLVSKKILRPNETGVAGIAVAVLLSVEELQAPSVDINPEIRVKLKMRCLFIKCLFIITASN